MCLRVQGDALFLAVRVTPKASNTGFSGFGEDSEGQAYLKVRVTAVPEKGKANKAVLALLSKALGMAKSRLFVVSGEGDRNKIIRINVAG
ncbi:MAG: DUF167 domain-containing protein, partial [Parvibaculaceae bacterium]|nr:DUF167 domain-containing protein [Parvibaculaceae bacterium]